MLTALFDKISNWFWAIWNTGMLADHSFFVYLTGTALGIYGVILFFVYWFRHSDHSMTALYGYLSLLIFGFTVKISIEMVMRVFSFHGYYSYLHEWWWPFRLYLENMAIALIVVHMTFRWIASARRYKLSKNILKYTRTKSGGKTVCCILVVEDHTPLWGVYQKVLGDFYEMYFVRSAEEALEQMNKINFRLMIVDIRLPGKIDGLALAAIVKRTSPLVYLLGVTGHPKEYGIETCLTAGFNEVLFKSFTVERLKAAVGIAMTITKRWELLATGEEFKSHV